MCSMLHSWCKAKQCMTTGHLPDQKGTKQVVLGCKTILFFLLLTIHCSADQHSTLKNKASILCKCLATTTTSLQQPPAHKIWNAELPQPQDTYSEPRPWMQSQPNLTYVADLHSTNKPIHTHIMSTKPVHTQTKQHVINQAAMSSNKQ
jgi:hypothetical protein